MVRFSRVLYCALWAVWKTGQKLATAFNGDADSKIRVIRMLEMKTEKASMEFEISMNLA